MLKRFVYALQNFCSLNKKSLVWYIISENGVLLNALYDPGKVIPEAGAVKEFDNKLYIGGDILPS